MTLVSELQDICSESCGHDSCACVICRAAYELEQLSSPVLPEEVAELVQRLNDGADRTFPLGKTSRDAARLLQRLAGELAEARDTVEATARVMCDLNDGCVALEAERYRLRTELETAKRTGYETWCVADAERTALRAELAEHRRFVSDLRDWRDKYGRIPGHVIDNRLDSLAKLDAKEG